MGLHGVKLMLRTLHCSSYCDKCELKSQAETFSGCLSPFLGMKSSSCGLIKVLTYDFKVCFAFRVLSTEFYVTPTAVSAESCSLNSTQKLLFDAYLNLISVNCSAYPVLQGVPHQQLLFLMSNVIPPRPLPYHLLNFL